MEEPTPAVGRPAPSRPWVVVLSWLLALLLTAPALVQVWTIDGLRIDASLLDLVREGGDASAGVRSAAYAAAIYLLACGGVWIWFILRCRIKRVLILSLATALGAIEWSSGIFGYDRILVALAVLAAAAVLVEVLRQNRALFADLRRSGLPMTRLLGRTLQLWSPSLLLIALGLYLGSLLTDGSIRAIYASGTVERWCELGGTDGPIRRPCSELVDPPAGQRIEALSIRRAIEVAVDDAVWAVRRQLLDATADLAPWATPASSRAALDRHLATVRFTLAPVLVSEGDDVNAVIARDDVLAHLRGLLRASPAPLPQPQVTLFRALADPGYLIRWATENQRRMDRIQSLKRRIAARERDLRADFNADNPAAPMKSRLQQQLAQRLGLPNEFKMAQSRLYAAWARRPAPAPEAVRATVRAELLRILADKQDTVVDATHAVVAGDVGLAIEAGLHAPRCLLVTADEDQGQDRLRACPDDGATGETGAHGSGPEPVPLPFVDSVKLSLDAWAERSERAIEDALQAASTASFKAGGDAERTAAALYDATPRSLGWRKDRRCGINPFCHAANYAKSRADAAYQQSRAEFQVRFQRMVQRNATLGVQGVNEQIDAARQAMRRNLERSHAAALQAVAGAHRQFEVLSAVMTVFLVFAAIKSFLYVLALNIFNESGAADIGFDVPATAEGSYVVEPSPTVPAGFGKGIRSFALGLNQTRRLVLWKPWVAFFDRLLRLRFLMNHGVHATDGAIKFPLGPGLSGVRWQMRDGEQVVFHFRDLLGFSDNVHIRTEVSLRLSTLLLGAYFFKVAQCRDGDGLLLLSIRGSSGLEGDRVEMVSVGTLKAWNLHTRFRVFGKQTVASVFKDGFTLSRREAGRPGRGKILAGASHGGELSVEGLAWYARTFLMPI